MLYFINILSFLFNPSTIFVFIVVLQMYNLKLNMWLWWCVHWKTKIHLHKKFVCIKCKFNLIRVDIKIFSIQINKLSSFFYSVVFNPHNSIWFECLCRFFVLKKCDFWMNLCEAPPTSTYVIWLYETKQRHVDSKNQCESNMYV